MKTKMLPKIKVGKYGTLRGIKKATIFGVHFDRGFWGILLQIVARFFTPYLWLPLWVLGGLTTLNVKDGKRQKKVIKNIFGTFSYCVPIDKVV